MMKLFKNNILNVLITTFFFFSQIINVQASHFKNDSQRENIVASVMEKSEKKAVNVASLFSIPSFTHHAKSEATAEGKIEKVFEPISLGLFSTMGALGFGSLTGVLMSLFSGILGWAIAKIKK
ncbi:hypothetical protein [Bartonella florencae]|uniref:hypothetical protein n=1 Tax=Bartonella florencae TaxID=928210 RepID=UPI0003143721|nr:hypothetical protein [Bartonella florencae]